jgi:hypothetical protein
MPEFDDVHNLATDIYWNGHFVSIVTGSPTTHCSIIELMHKLILLDRKDSFVRSTGICRISENYAEVVPTVLLLTSCVLLCWYSHCEIFLASNQDPY